MDDVLNQLAGTLDERKRADPETSYVASLHKDGLDRILKKVGEEAAEVIIAAKNLAEPTDEVLANEVVKETADLWFHSMVMLSHLGLSHQQVLSELERRFGISGITEKAERSK